MKRFLKWMTILGVLVSVAGLGMIAAGAAMGGTRYVVWALKDTVWRRGYDWDHWHGIMNEIPEVFVVHQEMEDVTLGEKHIEITIPRELENGALLVKDEISFENVREIEVEMFGNVMWKESDELKEGQIRIQKCNDGEDYRYGQKRDKLKILPETYPKGVLNSIVILVPAGTRLQEIHVKANVGEFWADRLQAGEISLESNAAQVTVLHVQSDQLELEARAGVIDCRAEDVREVYAECDMGQISLGLKGKMEDFSYELECDAGQILFGGSDGGNQGVHWEKEIENPGGKNVELECRAGVIAVDYWDGQAAE